MDDLYDIVIVGAGPAGSSAAQAAAERGAKVLLIDQRQRIGVPVQCAEFVPQWISRYVEVSSKCVLQPVEMMVTHLPDRSSFEMKSPGYMLDRSLFDKELAASAILNGARLLVQTRVTGFSSDGVAIERGTEKDIIRSKVVIGADGVHSTVARSLGYPPSNRIVALQYEVVIPRRQNHVDIFFDQAFEGGYAWLFPKGKTANLGLGVVPRKANNLTDLLKSFLDNLIASKTLPDIQIVGKTGGVIPCGRPRRSVSGNVLLVGDAAGHAHPITGAGILNAVNGGQMAGRIAAEAILQKDLRHLENYEMEWRETFGKSLHHAASRREFLEENWSRTGTDFGDLIHQTWVGFKEYYQDRRELND
jgi:digeranylgeranylglycerophospholipid reductase